MRRVIFIVMWGLMVSPLHAEVIDRIVAVVNGRIITQSDVRMERDIRMVLGGQEDEDETLIKQLIDSELVESQIEGFPGTDVDDGEVSTELAKLQNRGNLSLTVLEDAIRQRLRTAKYVQLQFRQFLRASDEDVRKYYDEVFVPEAKARGMNPIPPMEQVADAVQKNVVEEQLEHQVTIWLESVRRSSNIEILN